MALAQWLDGVPSMAVAEAESRASVVVLVALGSLAGLFICSAARSQLSSQRGEPLL
jgi:hypothetical protein